jgi:LPXTG-motif cell wall-anchored protein
MRRHVKMAKAAGIDGFLVSWKHTPQLDRRLRKLTSVARLENFKLGIVYQGLDFARKPLPLSTVRADLQLFIRQFAADPEFDLFGKPVVVWTGSYLYSRREIDQTVGDLRRNVAILSSAKNIKDYEEAAPVLDGDAYYWSSGDPHRVTYREKLVAMGQAVHARQGLWIAPAAPGYDTRATLGGSRVIDRRNGETLRAALVAGMSSKPDALGVISWNEFSENTYIEPSEKYGGRYLSVLAEVLGGKAELPSKDAPSGVGDSSGEGHRGPMAWQSVLTLGGLIAILSLWALLARRRKRG